MLRYTVKRLLFFVPSVFFISVICFVLVRSMPGDMVDFMIRAQTEEQGRSRESTTQYEKRYREKAAELGTDLPAFYIEQTSLAFPDSFSYEWNPIKKSVIRSLVRENGNFPAAHAWYAHLLRTQEELYATDSPFSDRQALIDAKRILSRLLYLEKIPDAVNAWHEFSGIADSDSLANIRFAGLIANSNPLLENIQDRSNRWKNYVPVLRFHSRCAYGVWLFGDGNLRKGIIRGDFGVSLIDKKNINTALAERIGLTITLSLVSVFLAFLVAVPLGILSALYHNTIFEKTVNAIIFILYALPSFWVASLCIMWLAGGNGVAWFAPYGTGKITPGMDTWDILWLKWRHFALPIFAWTYGGIAFITKQMQTAIRENMDKLYTLSAVARGLSLKTVVLRHVLPNSLRPLITMMANILPGLIGGSVVLETIFSLPGLGEWAYRGFFHRDVPVIMAVLFWSTILTLTGYLISDLLLAYTDPKVRFKSNKTT